MGHIHITSLKKIFGLELGWNKDSVVAPSKINITNLVPSFIYLEVTEMVSFLPSNDGHGISNSSRERRNEQTLYGTVNSETWCGKKQGTCYVLQVVYLKTLETTMRRLGIGEEKLMIITPLHIGRKRDVY
jgi:hypothetical protein